MAQEDLGIGCEHPPAVGIVFVRRQVLSQNCLSFSPIYKRLVGFVSGGKVAFEIVDKDVELQR